MTPGERAKHWAGAFMTLWPAWVFVLGMLGYTNKDEIKGLMFTSDGQKIVGLTPFEQTILNEIERIDLEEAEGRAKINALQEQLNKKRQENYHALNRRVKKLEALVD